jgi:predicted dehydrogenase
MTPTRRAVLKSTAAASAALAFGTVANAQETPERIVLCVMGTSSRGQSHANTLSSLPGVEIKYTCDVDDNNAAKCAALVEKKTGKKPQAIRDIRKVLDDKEITAITIATPDHWHTPAAILAAKAGKHVYVEKPCSHNPHEAVMLVQAARKYNRVIQVGTQRRSGPAFMQVIQMLREGIIGPVTFSRAWYNNARGSIGHGQPIPVPANLDWTMWQGPAPEKEFHSNYIHYDWHWFWNWGTGELGNNGVHALDICRWGLGVDYPKRVTSAGGRYCFQDDQETPDTNIVTFDFGDKLLTWEGRSCQLHGIEGEGYGSAWYGQKGSLILTDRNYTIYDAKDKQVKQEKVGFNDKDHFQNFLEAIRGKAKLNCEAEEGAKSTMLCHYGNIAWRTGKTLDIDPQTHKPTDKEALALWSRQYREGWEPTV